MTTMTSTAAAVIGGVDTHADVHVAAACDQLGAVLGTQSFRRLLPAIANCSLGCAPSARSPWSALRAPAPTALA
jgi:hypothetical protein